MKASLIGLIACCAVGSAAFASAPRVVMTDLPGSHPPQIAATPRLVG